MMRTRSQALLQDITDSFADAAMPDIAHLLEPGAEAELEGERIVAGFGGRRWWDVPHDVLVDRFEALEYFSPQAFRYYLPAFLIASVTYYADDDVLADYVISALTVPQPSDSDGMRDALVAELGDEGLIAPGDPIWARMQAYYSSGEGARHFSQRVSGFSPLQARAIRHFLEYMRDEHGADFSASGPTQALERYWNQIPK
jgi:uncharacterized protein DUF6714